MKEFIDVDKITQEEIESLIEGLFLQQQSIINGSIEVVGGVEEAKRIIENAPTGSNAYDIMYKEYAFLESFFMIDNNLTVNLKDLREALSNIEDK